MYNLTIRRVRITTVVVEVRARALCVCARAYVCSVSYPECNAHAPYCHLWLVRLHHSFPHYLTNGTILEKKQVFEHKICV